MAGLAPVPASVTAGRIVWGRGPTSERAAFVRFHPLYSHALRSADGSGYSASSFCFSRFYFTVRVAGKERRKREANRGLFRRKASSWRSNRKRGKERRSEREEEKLPVGGCKRRSVAVGARGRLGLRAACPRSNIRRRFVSFSPSFFLSFFPSFLPPVC